jgi:serine/threonine protein kinase
MQPSSLSCPICSTTNPPQADYCRACGYALQSHAPPSVFNTGTGQLLPRSLLNKRYRILRPIGQGGMGAVYEAEDTQLGNRKVALKEMRQSGLTPLEIANAAAAFRQEALLLAALQNPHLPNIYDHFSEFGRWYLVMSFIDGGTLEERLKKSPNERLPVAEALQIGIQLCTVLGYLHSQQPPIIFRDLKPSNIMYTTDEHIYLIDFGIARLFKPGQTKDTSLYASIGYASPEQYGKAQTNPQSDIYSLGVVLHQILSGYHPSATPFRLPSLQNSGQPIPQDLIKLIEEMTNLDEGKRPASVLIIKQKLQAIAAGLATVSPLPPTVFAKPSPLPPTIPAKSPAASVQPMNKPPVPSPQIAVQVAAPAIVKPVRVWGISGKQFLAMLVGIAISCAIEAFLVKQPSYNPILWGLTLSVPLFFATRFGPWVGFVTVPVGVFLGDLFSGLLSSPGSGTWFFYIVIALSSFVAGLAFIKTRGVYNTRGAVLLALMTGFIGIVIYTIGLILGDFIFFQVSISSTVSGLQVWVNLIALIPLPILLVIFNRIGNRNIQRNLP